MNSTNLKWTLTTFSSKEIIKPKQFQFKVSFRVSTKINITVYVSPFKLSHFLFEGLNTYSYKVGCRTPGASYRWSYRPNSAWNSINTTIGKTNPTLSYNGAHMKLVHIWYVLIKYGLWITIISMLSPDEVFSIELITRAKFIRAYFFSNSSESKLPGIYQDKPVETSYIRKVYR